MTHARTRYHATCRSLCPVSPRAETTLRGHLKTEAPRRGVHGSASDTKDTHETVDPHTDGLAFFAHCGLLRALVSRFKNPSRGS